MNWLPKTKNEKIKGKNGKALFVQCYNTDEAFPTFGVCKCLSHCKFRP